MAARIPLTIEGQRYDPRQRRAQAEPGIRVALVGNPNTGKTTLFNALTGFRRHVGNYPGVTVELARGPVRGARRPVELLDLPGTYSLSAISPDEAIVARLLAGREGGHGAPDAIVAIVDASNLRRNLYLVSQLLEFGKPLVIALNMVDVARGKGIAVDCGKLSRAIGVPVVPIVATRPDTIPPLVHAIDELPGTPPSPVRATLPEALCHTACSLCACAPGGLPECLALRALVDRDGHAEEEFVRLGGSEAELAAARERLQAAGVTGVADEARARYAWIDAVLSAAVTRSDRPIETWSEQADRLLMHRFVGPATLAAVLFLVFQSIFRWAAPLMDAIDGAFGWLGAAVGDALGESLLKSLLVDGVIAGVGGVLIFLPQIMILFGLIAILEDCGYMARAAHMLDRLMRGLGLSGRAFIPLLSSFACAVPAIMGTRVIGDVRERFVTILIAPFMSCSARLPVYTLMIAAFIPEREYLGGWVVRSGLVMFAMYLLGVAVSIPIAWLLKRTAFAGPRPVFMLELPTYKLPSARLVLQRMLSAGRSFVVRAGTVILAVNLVVWALAYFPRDARVEQAVRAAAAAEGWEDARIEEEVAGAYLRDSYLGRLGHAIEPAVRPLGWDWRIGMAVIASFPAREVVLGTLSTIFNVGAEEDEAAPRLRDALTQAKWPDSGRPVFTVPVALSLMVFFALCAQCSSTLVTIGRETRSWVWPVVSFLGMTGLAYLGALVTVWAAAKLA